MNYVGRKEVLVCTFVYVHVIDHVSDKETVPDVVDAVAE